MWIWIGLTLIGLLVVGLVLWVGLIVSMRTKYSPGLTAVRRMNRRFTNPRVLRTAGTPGAAYAVIHHAGRSTGTPYRTPIGVADTDDGFVIALPYGTSPDWLKNVRAAGTAIIDSDGRRYQVAEPRVVGPTEVVRYFAAKDRRSFRIYGVDKFLALTRVGADVPAGGRS